MPDFRQLRETVFSWAAPPIKFGLGASEELGYDLAQLGVRSCLVLTDAGVRGTGIIETLTHHLKTEGIDFDVYDGVSVEPTNRSWQDVINFVRSGTWEAFVAVGGGSVIDTAKVANLFYTNEGDILDYVAPPVGLGRRPQSPLRPLVAIPTTAGTGSEATSIAVVDLLDLHLKAGISHPALRPSLAIVDPNLTISLPPEVTAACGMDVLTHAIESYTAKTFSHRPAYQHPSQRVAFAGANPISDLFCERAIQLVGEHLRRAVLNGYDVEARYGMALAAMYAGIGFGNAGTHIPHANAYPIAGQVNEYQASGYPPMPMVPHGQAVASTAIAAFMFTFPTSPERHHQVASLLSARSIDVQEGAEALPTVLRELMKDIGIPRGIAAFGYTEEDVEALAEGTMKQQRQLQASPRILTMDTARDIFRQSLRED